MNKPSKKIHLLKVMKDGIEFNGVFKSFLDQMSYSPAAIIKRAVNSADKIVVDFKEIQLLYPACPTNIFGQLKTVLTEEQFKKIEFINLTRMQYINNIMLQIAYTINTFSNSSKGVDTKSAIHFLWKTLNSVEINQYDLEQVGDRELSQYDLVYVKHRDCSYQPMIVDEVTNFGEKEAIFTDLHKTGKYLKDYAYVLKEYNENMYFFKGE